MRIINNTDQSIYRLLVLFEVELRRVRELDIECIVFDPCRMLVWGVDKLLLDINDEEN